MNGRLSESHARAITTGLSVVTGITAIVGLVTLPLPLVAGTLVLAIGFAYWALRNEWPSLQGVVSVAAIALALTAGLAWLETQGGANSYDFIVVPERDYAVESAFPGPRHDVASLLEYGKHVQVTCLIKGEDGHDWAELGNGYFLPVGELAPAPHNDGDPPGC